MYEGGSLTPAVVPVERPICRQPSALPLLQVVVYGSCHQCNEVAVDVIEEIAEFSADSLQAGKIVEVYNLDDCRVQEAEAVFLASPDSQQVSV